MARPILSRSEMERKFLNLNNKPMRTIEFRAWHNRKKKMLDDIDWRYLAISKDWILVYPWHTSLEEADKDIKLMQYTWLLDKNGVKIYEGDIVKVPDDYDTYWFMAWEIREIVFIAWGFRFKSSQKNQRWHWIEDDWEFEVIGNTYEHPNLLQQ